MTDLDPLWNDDEPDPLRFELPPWSGELRRGGSLSDLSYAGVPVLRAVRPVLRDRDWRTVPATVSSLDEIPGGLSINGTFHDDSGEDLVAADWWIDVRASDEALTVEFSSAARTTFQRNRFGLVLLHRPDDAGTPLRVGHPDGTSTETGFPVAIAPHQPARDIASLQWSRPGVDVTVEFTGDVFEMEDQRNWTDASFKTYSTPLDEPFPVEVPVGATVRQRIVVRCVLDASPVPDPVTAAGGGAGQHVDLVPTGHPLPQWGTTTVVDGVEAPLLVELVTADPQWPDLLAAAVGTGAPLDVRIVTDDPATSAAVLQALPAEGVLRVGVHSLTTHVSTAELWQALRSGAAQRGLGADLVAGARSHFTELNRTREQLPADAAGVVFSSTPQMHDVGRDQVVEALPVQRLTAEQAVELAAGRPVHVGPVTLRARFNAVATTPWRIDRDRVTADPRSRGRAFAAWVVASAAAFSVRGVASVTFGDLDGPAADSLRELCRLTGWERLEVVGALPAGVHVVAGGLGARAVALVANLAGAVRRVRVAGVDVVVAAGGVEVVEVGASR